MIDKNRRAILASGAAAAAAGAAPQVFAQAPQAGEAPQASQAQQAGAVQGMPAGAKVGFYEKGNVRIRYLRAILANHRPRAQGLGDNEIVNAC